MHAVFATYIQKVQVWDNYRQSCNMAEKKRRIYEYRV